jgi:molybdate transport system substrate-binding protein
MRKLRLLTNVVTLTCLFFAVSCARRNGAEPVGKPEVLVAAASDLALAFEEVGRLFEQEKGIKITFTFGSTGILAKQIENGAPFDLFAAANIAFIDQLDKKGLVLPDTKAVYARGRITMWTRAESPLKIERVEDLSHPDINKIAIANPEHAPYGLAAREALQSAGVWDKIREKLVLGENIRQTLQYAETGNVEVAIVALSLSIRSPGRWTLIPEQMHKPLDQALAVVRAARHEKEAREFAAFLATAQARAIMRSYGFILPGESA